MLNGGLSHCNLCDDVIMHDVIRVVMVSQVGQGHPRFVFKEMKILKQIKI